MVNYSITELDISKKELTQLPSDIDKYTNLKNLDCSWNKLTSLNNLPASLEKLYCCINSLIYDFEPTIENIKKYNASIANIPCS